MRRVMAAGLLMAFGSAEVGAQKASADQRLLFAPAPLGTPAGLQGPVSPARSAATSARPIPLPRARPAATQAVAAPPALRVDLSSPASQAFRPDAGASLFSAPDAAAFDLSRGLDLGGASLGLETGRGSNTGGAMNLLAPEARNAPWTDPTLAEKRRSSSPFLGLSLSAPTN